MSVKDIKHFKETCLPVLNTIAPLKSRFIRANQTSFINKEIQQVIIVRSKLRKQIFKSRFIRYKKAYNKQIDKGVILLMKTKKAYYPNLNMKNIADYKKFWKTVKGFFSDKSSNFENISY